MNLNYENIIKYRIGTNYLKDDVVTMNGNTFISLCDGNETIPNKSNLWKLIK